MKLFQPITLFLVATGQCSMSNAFSLNNNNNNNNPSDRRSFLNKLQTTATIATTAAVTGTVTNILPVPAAFAATDENGLLVGGKLRLGDESIMSPKAHGTSETPVQDSLRYGVSNKLADKITNYNRRFAEFGMCTISIIL